MLPSFRVAEFIYWLCELNPEIFGWYLLEALKRDFGSRLDEIHFWIWMMRHPMHLELEMRPKKTSLKVNKGPEVSGKVDSIRFELVPEKSGK